MVEDNSAKSKQQLNTEADMVTDLVVRVSALEQVLIKKNLVSESEYAAELQGIVNKMSGFVELMIEKNQGQSSESDAAKTEQDG